MVRVKLLAAPRDAAVRDELNETLARCREIFLESGQLWRTRERSDWVSAQITPLYSALPPQGEEMRAFAALAFGGWCWREAEDGDTSVVEAAVQASYAAALADPSVSDEIAPAWASWKFLVAGGEPGAASPGATRRARVTFLEAAATKFQATYGLPASVRADRGREAFRRGVVLNDVERLALHRPALR